MTTKNKAKLKKTITGLLCLAALTSGVVVPAYLPSVFPTITAAAEEPNPVGENVIDLSKLVDYLSDSSALPEGVSVKHPENFDDIIEVTITQGGTYKLTGSNYINGSYLDVKFIIKADVTFYCEDVFIKNDKEAKVIRGYNAPEGSYSSNTSLCSGYTLYNYVVPFVTSGGSLTLKGKLYIDTPFAEYPDGHIATPAYEGSVNVHGDKEEVYFYELNNGTQKDLDKNYFIRYKADSAEENSYNIGDYIDVSPYKCISVNGGSKRTFGGVVPKIHLGEEHNIDENGHCSQCNGTFDVHTVTINDGSGTNQTVKVTNGDTIDPPAAPPAPIGKKFDCWVDENGKKFDFTKPISDNVTIIAKFADSSIKSVAAVTAPTNEYKEGDKFDPTGLKINVTYDDDRFEEIEYNESTKDKFTFSPALDTELSPNDTKITVTYGEKAENGSNTLDIPINVAERQVTGIAIKTEPTKTTYIEGEKFDPTGLVLTVTYDNGETKDIAYNAYDFTFTPSGALSVRDNFVSITYGGRTAMVDITVEENEENDWPYDDIVINAKIDMPIDVLMDSVLDEEDRMLIEQGVDISVLMATVTIDPEVVPEIDKAAINSVLDDFTIGCYIDVALFKRYSNGNPDKPVTDPSSPITISFELPQYILNMYPDDEYEYTLFCSHNGSGYEVDSWYDPLTHIMSFSSDKFSTYALGVKEAAVEEETPSHSHEYGKTWESDDAFHWHECECGEKSDVERHISDDGKVTVQPTAYTTGIRTYSCSVCGYVLRTETIPATGHNDYPSYPTYPTYPNYVPSVTTTPSVFTTAPEVEAEVNGSSVTLKWDGIKNAEKYYVYQYKDGKYVRVKTTTDTTVTFKNLKNGETYKFLVRYTINGKLSPTSYSSKFTVKVYYKPLPKATSTNNSVKLTWAAVPNAEKYAIYKYVDGKAVKLTETEKRAINIRGLTSDTEYKYIVRAYVNGKWTTMLKSDIVTVKTKAE